MTSDIPKHVPKPRLCHLIKWPDFDGYGFNLHAEKTKSGQFIGQVDDDSPAESAGLKQGDRIIEVNNVNIANENHKQVVERIKAIPNETKLLVLDEEADKYYKSKKILVKGTLPYVLRMKTQIPRPRKGSVDRSSDGDRPSVNGSNGEHTTANPPSNGKVNGNIGHDDSEGDERRSQISASSDRDFTTNDDKVSHNSGSNRSTPSAGRKEDDSLSSKSSGASKSSAGSVSKESPSTVTPPRTPVNSTSPGGEAVNHGSENGLNLNMTAQQMRAMLANRKKYDPKKESMDLRKKHAIIQQM